MLSNLNQTKSNEELISTINLFVYILIMIVGLIWNGTLLFMFARHKEIRTTANTMIFNLALCDVVNLVIVAPLRYKYHYPHNLPKNIDLCRVLCVFQYWILCAGALTLVALSIQRFSVTVPRVTVYIGFISKNTHLITALYILSIWMVALVMSVPYGVIWEIYGYLCGNCKNKFGTKIMILVNFIFYCLLLPFLMFFFNLATARRLNESIQNFVGVVNNRTRDVVRKRSANVVTALSVLFLLNHLPYFIWCFYAYWTDVNRGNTTALILEYVSKYFLFLNSCFNPIALYMTSSTFRKLFRRYL